MVSLAENEVPPGNGTGNDRWLWGWNWNDGHQWTTYMACDPHPVTAHASVWMIINKQGKMIVPFSWFPEEENDVRVEKNRPRLQIEDYLQKYYAVESMGLFPPPYRELMDQAGKGMYDNGFNFFERYRRPRWGGRAIHFYEARRNDFTGKQHGGDTQYHGYAEISAAFTEKEFEIKTEDGKVERFVEPALTVLRHFHGVPMGHNAKLVEQLKQLRRKELRGIAAEERDRPDEPASKERHLIDCLSYILMDKPRFVPPKDPNRDRGELPRTLRVGAHSRAD